MTSITDRGTTMGTTFNNGDKPENKVTISRSSGEPHKVNPDTKRVDRSFAQPNPALDPQVEPKAHANAQDEVEALNDNSKQGRKYAKNNDKKD